MGVLKKNGTFYFFSLCLLLSIIALSLYLSRVYFAGDINIEIKTKADNLRNIQIYATTPTEKQQPFYRTGDSVYNLSGYYNDICLSIDSNVIRKIDTDDSLNICINDNYSEFSWNYILHKWKYITVKNQCVYSVPESLQTNITFISKLNAFLVYSDVPLIKIFIYALVCLIIIVPLLFYYKFKTFFANKIKLVSTRALIVFLSLLTLIYFGVFLKYSSFSNAVTLSDDSWEYQVMAVNFAKGHGLQRLAMLEPFDTYKFNKALVDAASLNNLQKSPIYKVDTYHTPGYAVFLGLIYKIAGINPYAAKAVQLFILCFVASFVSYLLYVLWQWRGLLSGIAGGFVFLISHYTSAGSIMSEVLLVFISFLLMALVVGFNKKPSYFLSILTGLIMGVSLLVKGMIIFVPVLFLGFLLVRFFKSKDRFLKQNILLVFLFFVLTILPWSIYASNVNRFLFIKPFSKKERL